MVLLGAMVFCSIVFPVMPSVAEATSPVPVEGVRFDVALSVKDNLKALAGKDVYVHLRGDKTLQGYVKAVGDSLVHLERLAGRNFSDALIRIEDISAVEVKFRDIK